MSKRQPQKSVSVTDVARRLRKALAKQTKSKLVDLLVELATEDRGVFRRVDKYLDLQASIPDLVIASRQAIADATAFDKRDYNRNFSFDQEAYEEVQRNLKRFVGLQEYSLAMELSLELMDQGSHQAEASDEGFMIPQIEACLQVVLDALPKSDLPLNQKIAWCNELLLVDRIGGISETEILALRNYLSTLQ